jgi:hypothetical protein
VSCIVYYSARQLHVTLVYFYLHPEIYPGNISNNKVDCKRSIPVVWLSCLILSPAAYSRPEAGGEFWKNVILPGRVPEGLRSSLFANSPVSTTTCLDCERAIRSLKGVSLNKGKIKCSCRFYRRFYVYRLVVRYDAPRIKQTPEPALLKQLKFIRRHKKIEKKSTIVWIR